MRDAAAAAVAADDFIKSVCVASRRALLCVMAPADVINIYLQIISALCALSCIFKSPSVIFFENQRCLDENASAALIHDEKPDPDA